MTQSFPIRRPAPPAGLLPRTQWRCTLTALALLAAGLIPSLVAAADTPAAGKNAPVARAASAPAAAADATPAPLTETRILTFSKMTGLKTVPLRTSDGHAVVDFGIRRDEIVTHAVLRLRYTYSPALIATQSHIKLSMNGELVGVVPIVKEDAGKKLVYETEIDPRLITGFSKLGLNFIGHYTNECEDPIHSSLWADISGTSEIILSVQKLATANDLASLPEPFFDRYDNRRLQLNFIFADKPSRGTLQAAAVTASWFGKLAGYRGARFPAALNSLPSGHGIVFAPNGERPAALAGLPPATRPGILVMTSPVDPSAKLLVLLGRNSDDIRHAAIALSQGNLAMSGTQVTVTEGIPAAPRAAYDAPNWVRLDRPMRFAELADSPLALQVQGHEPPPITINLRIPPDLFTWRSKGIPLDLKYRYSPPSRLSESRLTMRINNELVQAFNLTSANTTTEATRLRLPVLDDGLQAVAQTVLIPAFKLGIRNSLQYGFSFTYLKEGNCRDGQVDDISAMIDADSKIDFSGLPNFAEMPNLGFFVTSGFPFTKYADLAQTVVVLADTPARADIETMLALMGRMGESTGVPATRVRIASSADETALKDADLLIIGATQPLLRKWGTQLPAGVLDSMKRVSLPARPMGFLFDWFGLNAKPDPTIISQENIEGAGPLALMLGFESPLTPERSVVAVTASRTGELVNVLDALDDPVRAATIRGSAAFVRGEQVDSVLAGRTYTVGTLPFFTGFWYAMSSHPVLLALAVLLAVLIFGFALWRGLRAVAARRGSGA
ncbi:MAG: cellulose biosynthesis cyclic di-GMP-binding regulatory protein BcsB [Herminiimonas sp.]|nr:cellulose biosynthesis cyclic di-GMP-binding regulatory protein BcsB [Herminiimonas sp.]